METFASLFIKLATKAGLNIEDADVKALTTNADLLKLQVPDAVSTGIDNNLLSLAQAQDNHPTLKKHYHAQTLAGFDKKLSDLMSESDLPAEKIAELQNEKNTYQRFDAFATALKDHASTASKSKSGEEKTALQKQNEDLLNQLKTQKSTFESQIATLSTERQKDAVNFEVKTMLAGAKTIFDDLPPTAKFAALNTLISAALTGKEAGFALDETGGLTLKGKDDTVVLTANQTKYTPQTFIDEVLATNKVLKVADPNAATTGQQNGNGQNGQNGRANGSVQLPNTAQTGNSQAIADANRATLQAYLKNTGQAV
jgi:hypothetical protein